MKKLTLLMACFALLSCGKQSAPVSLGWEFGRCDDGERSRSMAYLTINNLSKHALEADWTIYTCMEGMSPVAEVPEEAEVWEYQIQGSYHCIKPTANYQPIPAGESRTYTIRYRGSAIRENIHPEGSFIVFDKDDKPVSIDITCQPYTRREQMMRGEIAEYPFTYADGEYVYQYNQAKTEGAKRDNLLHIFPQPKSVTMGETACDIEKAERVVRLGAKMPAEGYSIAFTADTVFIDAADEAGAYYAELTLGQIPSPTQVAQIVDFPDFHHRGVMLDIVRNYYPLDSMLRIVDVMAQNKLNVLHFHLSDDEAWRVEMPSLPELTAKASRRGYTHDEKDFLLPMYCGGWNPDDKTSTANGYYTTADFIRLLRYAKERHIRVIPEIDMPGHMRACKKALRPLLSDSLMDTRSYYGAQEYTDNVIAVTNPYALTFIETLVKDFKTMYDEAGCEFTVFNIGGDEVPEGSLTKEEHQQFIDGVLAILQRYNLQPMGWEEITQFCQPESKAICYSWHNGEEKPSEMANAGYPVVLATANHLYFDFAYCYHHEEKGLSWGGYTDEWASFDWLPLQHPNIIGLNAQMWAEEYRCFAQVEWQIFPKIFGLAERAWNSRSELTVPEYTDLVYQYAMPRLHAEGHNFHVQMPGIHVENEQVVMNKVMTEGQIFYTLDDEKWYEYTEPFALPEGTQTIKAYVRYLDHESTKVWWWNPATL